MAFNAMKAICKFSWCSEVINFKNSGSNAMGSLVDYIPCVLRLHKIVVEKKLRLLLYIQSTRMGMIKIVED
jgi:hypothetical protein